MKKLYSIILASVALFGWSCSESGIVEDSNPVETRVVALINSPDSPDSPDSLVSSFEADKAFISECGYDTSDMVEYEDYYRVGAELLFYKSYVLECRKTPQLRLNYAKTIAEEWQKIYLHAACSDFDDGDRIKDAAKAWNEIGNCNLNFKSLFKNIIYNHFNISAIKARYIIFSEHTTFRS